MAVHSPVVSSGQQVDLGVGREDPEAIVLAAEGLDAGALGHVPDADGLVLAVGDDQVLLRAGQKGASSLAMVSLAIACPAISARAIFTAAPSRATMTRPAG